MVNGRGRTAGRGRWTNGGIDRRRRLAEAEGVTRSFVNRLLRLTLLAPDIIEAILDGRQPKAMQLEELTRAHADSVGGTTPAVSS